MRQGEQSPQRGDGPRRHQRSRGELGVLGTHRMDGDRRPGRALRLVKERHLAMISLDQVKPPASRYRQHEAREPRPGTDIDGFGRSGWNEREQLQAVAHMSWPDIILVVAGNQIDRGIPPPEKGDECLEPGACFT